jgi:hypothetical protein
MDGPAWTSKPTIVMAGLDPAIVRPQACFVREVQVHPRRPYRPEARGNCADREAAWGATRGERAIRRRTNSIRPRRLASLRWNGEAPTRANGKPTTLTAGVKAMAGAARWLETESLEGGTRDVERPARQQGAQAHRAGVRTLIVAVKPGNAGGAKGCRKVET